MLNPGEVEILSGIFCQPFKQISLFLVPNVEECLILLDHVVVLSKSKLEGKLLKLTQRNHYRRHLLFNSHFDFGK